MTTKQISIQNRNPSSPRDEFRATAERIALLAYREGIEIRPFRSDDLPLYSALPLEEQEHSLWMAKTLLEIIESMQANSESLRVSRRLIWHFLKMEKYTAPSDFIERIDEHDTVDIYSTSHKLIFANLAFFDICSYSLEELYCLPWRELFSRDIPEVQGRLFEAIQRLLSGDANGLVDVRSVGEHVVIEAMAPNGVHAKVAPKVIAPIFERKKLVGYACVNRILKARV